MKTKIGRRLMRQISALSLFVFAFQLLFGISAFADPGKKESQDAFDFMQGLGCVTGFTDGAHLNDTMTRAQAVTDLVKCTGQYGSSKYLNGAPSFTDTSWHWASGAIAMAKSMGWVGGYPDGKFHPDDPVTQAELIQMLDKILGLQVDSNLKWPDRALKPAVDAGVITQDDYSVLLSGANTAVSRGALFYYANRAFSNVPLANGKTVYEQTFGVARKPPEKIPDPVTDPAIKQITPPVYIPPSPPGGGYYSVPSASATVTAVSDVSVQIKIITIYTDNLYYVVLPTGSPWPSDSQMILGKDSAGNTVGIGKSGSIARPSSETTISLTALIPNTAYSIYILANGPANSSAVSNVDFTTAIAANAPSVTNAVYTSVTDSVYNITASFSNASKLYYVVPNDEMPLTPDQVKSFHGLRPALASGSVDVPASSNNSTFPVTLQNLYLYNMYIVVEYGGRLSDIYTMHFSLP